MTVRIARWLVLFFVTLYAGCTEQNADLFITANLQPSSECVVLPDSPRLFGGVLDTGLARGVEPTSSYTVYPLYQNQMKNRSSVAPLRADPNGFTVLGAEVQLVGADGTSLALPGGLANPYTIVAGESTYVPASLANEVSAQPGALEIIPSHYVEALDEVVLSVGAFTMLAVVTAFGVTTGDNELELNPWKWSIRVARWALVDFASGDDPATPGVCDSTEAASDTPCKPLGADEPVDCRYCRASLNPEVAACCGQGLCE